MSAHQVGEIGARRAVIRADASVAIGGGHVRRCLVLAEALSDAGWQISFAIGPDTLETLPRLARSPFARAQLQPDDQVNRIRQCFPSGCDLLIVDHYGIDADFERACRGWAKRILVIDDLADRPHDCDVLVDQTPGRPASEYASFVPADCVVLMGPAYALLDPRFRTLRRQARPVAERVGRVLVSFGSTDSGDMTSVALKALRIAGLGAETDVVLGKSSPNFARVRELVSTLSPAAEIHVEVDDMAAMTGRADAAIGAGGVSSLERCCLGVPSLLITTADNQFCNSEALAAAGAAVVLGPASGVDPAAIARALRALAQDPARRRTMSESARALCDGAGATRVFNAVEERMRTGGPSSPSRSRLAGS